MKYKTNKDIRVNAFVSKYADFDFSNIHLV